MQMQYQAFFLDVHAATKSRASGRQRGHKSSVCAAYKLTHFRRIVKPLWHDMLMDLRGIAQRKVPGLKWL
jgi:hypothetical protein